VSYFVLLLPYSAAVAVDLIRSSNPNSSAAAATRALHLVGSSRHRWRWTAPHDVDGRCISLGGDDDCVAEAGVLLLPFLR
jgi:hypothetical protein